MLPTSPPWDIAGDVHVGHDDLNVTDHKERDSENQGTDVQHN